jgi:hypothetical protein
MLVTGTFTETTAAISAPAALDTSSHRPKPKLAAIRVNRFMVA